MTGYVFLSFTVKSPRPLWQPRRTGDARVGQWSSTDQGAVARTGTRVPPSPGRVALTLVADEEAHAGAAAVGGEEQVQDVPGADEEARGLRAVELADERGRCGRAVPHLQRVVVDFRLEPADTGRRPALRCGARGLTRIPTAPALTAHKPVTQAPWDSARRHACKGRAFSTGNGAPPPLLLLNTLSCAITDKKGTVPQL